MRTRNANTSKSAAPKKTPPARKSATRIAGESPASKRTPPARTRNAKKKEPSPVSDSNPDHAPQEQKSVASATTSKSAKKKTPGRLRSKAVPAPNLEEQLDAVADETPIVDNSEAADNVEEPGDVEMVDASNIEVEKEREQGIESVGLLDEKELKSMDLDAPIENVCESEEKGKNSVEVEVTESRDVSKSVKQPGCSIVDLNLLSADNEGSTGAKEGEEELKEHEAEKGKGELKELKGEKEKEELKEREVVKGKEELKELGEKGKEELKEHGREKGQEQMKDQGEKGDEEFKEQEGEKGKEELKAHDVEKEKEELKQQEGVKGMEECKEQEGGKGELKEQERKAGKEEREGEKGKAEFKEQGQEEEKGKEELKKEEVEKGKEELKEQEGEKREELMEREGEKGKGEKTNIIGHEEKREVGVNREKDGDEGPKGGEKLDHLLEEDPEEDPEEPPEETETLEEHMELEAIAKQRKIKKEHEIFVGGLDRDATEEDLRKVFQRIGEVAEVRLHKNSSTNKNKGYAFVKFANKEHAKRALSEMKNPVIHGKRCGTAPSEDNDTLFLGNICNTWTKEAIKQKLKAYGIEGVENITLVPDVQHEGLSRGFAFLEFSCHADAMLAYKRLQKPDVIFGHAERTAKVAFAEPIREPDPEIMAQVKSVFINGLPLHWEENHVRELLQPYGEIVRVVLARNMSTAKRKDYGFVDFSTHEAAVACVNGVNKSEMGDDASKTQVRARLSNPLPKTQAVKGGMCGGFRIGHARSGAFPRSGRGFGRGRQPFHNRGNFNRDRSFHRGGHSQVGRMGYRDDFDFNMYPDFHHRQFGPQAQGPGPVRGAHYAGSRGAAFAPPSRPYHDRHWYGIPGGGPSEPTPPRRPYSPRGQFDAPFMERHFDDPYLYDDNMHGMKRPFYMTDPEPDYMGPSRVRPRLDYADPSAFHGARYHDSFGAGGRQYPHDYYGSDLGRGPYSSYYGGGGSHGRGYYY